MVASGRILVSALLSASAAACSIAGAGCSQPTTLEGAAPEHARARTDGIVIAQLVTHDAKVAIVGGLGPRDGNELRVVVRKLDGTMVADGITVADLRARDPELFAIVTSSFAAKEVSGQEVSGHGYVDATLDLPHIN